MSHRGIILSLSLAVLTLTGCSNCGTSCGLESREVEYLSEDVVDLMTNVFQASENAYLGDTVHPGDVIAVWIVGDVFSGATGVKFGPGIAVQSVHVIDDGNITVSIRIEELAEPGPRDVIVESPSGYGLMPGGFTVV